MLLILGVEPECENENYAPEGKPLFEIVNSFANDGELWLKVYVRATQKMRQNGYFGDDLKELTNLTFLYG